MKFFYKTLLLALASLPVGLMAQSILWKATSESALQRTNAKRLVVPNNYKLMLLDTVALKATLSSAPKEFTQAAKTQPLIFSIPFPDGSFQRFELVETKMMEDGLSAKFPYFKTYSGQGIDDRTATISISWTALGFQAQVLSPLMENPVYIDPYALGDKLNYVVYAKNNLKAKPFVEKEMETELHTQFNQQRTAAGFCFGAQLRTYRAAIACTGEYTAYFGGTVAAALSAITNTMNRVNQVYETEVAIRMILIANNNLIVYTNAATDPYSQIDVNSALLNENQTAIDIAIGTSNYDIGHLFTTIDGGGLAGFGVVCLTGNKARAATGLANPSGDAYDIDFVAHEIGHQFGGSHTFNATTGNCAPPNRSGTTAVEPGSGVTIMAYAGICGAANNIAGNSIPYFHTVSQGQIGTYSNTGTGNTCAALIATGNTAPVVNAGLDYTIPAGTPFMLTGSATDANGDVLTYSWEQYDAGVAGNWNSGSNPFFRSFSPTTSPTRYFPQLSDVANGTTTIGEFLPTTSQTMNFRLTARDNRRGGGGVCSDEVIVSTVAGTPFTVTSQNTATTWSANGTSTATITWNVAGTNASPFNASTVSILFSADGGLTFPYTLLASTPNNGSASVIIPSVATQNGKIMVRANGNVFFNLNSGKITVTLANSCVAEGAVVAPATTVNANPGNSTLNLSLAPQFSTPLTIAGTLTTSDPTMNLSIFSSVISGCQAFSNVSYHDTYTFTAGATGSYTFTLATFNSTALTLYQTSFNPASSCSNFLRSNLTWNGTSVSGSGSLTHSLVAGSTYVLVVGTFNATQPTLPANYTVTYTGGTLNSGSGVYTNPGASYSYAYVVVNNSTNNVVAINSTANLTNATTYPIGTYSVYGISYLTSQASLISAFVGGSFAALTNSLATQPNTYCANLSKNAVSVNIVANTSALPVSFTGLKARKVNNTVQLQWGTANETNSSHFVVERSADGTNFTTNVGTLAAAGYSSTAKTYTLNDLTPIKGLSYYRVKQYDLDGKFSYSNVAAINFDKAGNLIIVYPNPAKDKVNVEYVTSKTGSATIDVVDVRGVTVAKQVNAVNVGTNIIAINTQSLAAGVYILKLIDVDGTVTNTRFVKQ